MEESEIKAPNSRISFTAGGVDALHSLHGFAYSTALPIIRRHAHIPLFCLPLAIYILLLFLKFFNKFFRTFSLLLCVYLSNIFIYIYISIHRLPSHNETKIHVTLSKNKQKLQVPGGVPQHMEWSSTCSTSRPMNHEPNDTSSFANRCKMGLPIFIHPFIYFMEIRQTTTKRPKVSAHQ